MGEIRSERTVGQTFVAQHDGLQAIDVLLATFARKNSHSIILHLRADPQSDEDLRTVVITAAEIADNAYQRFGFAPIPDSHHKRYYFFIESPESERGDAITAWTGPADSYREGSLYRSGQAKEGQLTFKLHYGYPQIVLGLARDLLMAVPFALVTAALFLLPGLAFLVWLAPICEWQGRLTLIVATGLSAALFPLLLLVSKLLGLRWNSQLVWLGLALCLGLIVWRFRHPVSRNRIRSNLSPPARRLSLETCLFLAVIALVFGVRWLVARPLSAPMWGDSVQHTYIAQLMVERGGLYESWEPYSPYTSLTVHFGFHAAVAFFHWATGIVMLKSVILVGQVFNGLAALALYPLAVRISGGRRWAGIATVLVAGLLMPMPMEYVNWGRYPQLAGQMILPLALWLLWVVADHRGKGGWGLGTLAAIAAVGMSLTYYRMPYYYAAFVLVWLIFYCWPTWRGDKAHWLALAGRLVWVGALALTLILPWGSNILGGRLVTSLEKGLSATPSWEYIRAEYMVWRDIDVYVPRLLYFLAFLALAWALLRRRWTAVMLGLWTAVLASLVAARLIHLPGASHMQSFAILIALYLPLGLMVGWLFGEVAAAATRRYEVWGARAVAAVLLIVALVGGNARMTVVNPAYALVNRADEAAMDWIRANTPLDATFLVNGFLIYAGTSAVGSDAGWWIPFLAGRANTMPPQYALFNEAEATPGYGRAMVQLVTDLNSTPPTTEAGLDALCRSGVTHIYVGQGQGRVAQMALTPYLVPEELVASSDFDLIYHQDRVWIFVVKDGVCF